MPLFTSGSRALFRLRQARSLSVLERDDKKPKREQTRERRETRDAGPARGSNETAAMGNKSQVMVSGFCFHVFFSFRNYLSLSFSPCLSFLPLSLFLPPGRRTKKCKCVAVVMMMMMMMMSIGVCFNELSQTFLRISLLSLTRTRSLPLRRQQQGPQRGCSLLPSRPG